MKYPIYRKTLAPHPEFYRLESETKVTSIRTGNIQGIGIGTIEPHQHDGIFNRDHSTESEFNSELEKMLALITNVH